jgi:Domain of unknown function (DUF5615)
VTLALYMDHNVPRAITAGLQRRGIDVLSAYEDGAHELEDAALLDRAQALGRVLFSRDDDLLREAARRQREGISFGGVIYAHQREVSIGRCTLDLHLLAEASEPEELRDRVIYLPL